MKDKSLIAQIFYKERGNYETIPQSEKYKKALQVLVEKDEEMRAQLKNLPDLLQIYNDVTWAEGDLNCKSVEDHFLEGFRVGFLLALDVVGYE